MVFRSFLIVALTLGTFFYWDINHNKSVYTHSIEKVLDKYGLLEQTIKLIESVKSLLLTIKSLINYYVPLWYQKFNKTVVPVVLNGWKVTNEYVIIVWNNSKPYRDLVVLYTNQAVDYLQANFPILIKNLVSLFELSIHYATTVLNFCIYYTTIALDFIGIQLLGWKKGEFEKIFIDAFKVFLEYLTQFFQWLNKNINQK